MAFPTSSLTNNQVHKEGNRAFVYDSALGVWDQVRETDRTENKIFSGDIGSSVTFPNGHVIQTVSEVISTAGSDRSHTLSQSYTIIQMVSNLQITGFTATDGNTLIITTGGYNMRCTEDSTYRFEQAFFSDSTNLGSINTFSQGSNFRKDCGWCLVKENISGFSSVTISARAKKESAGTPPTMTLGAQASHSGQGQQYIFLMVQEIQA